MNAGLGFTLILSAWALIMGGDMLKYAVSRIKKPLCSACCKITDLSTPIV